MFTLFQLFRGRRFPSTKEDFAFFFGAVLLAVVAWFLVAAYRAWRNKERSDWEE